MNKYIFLLCGIALLWNCQSDQQSTEEILSVATLEKNYDDNPSGENLELLLSAYAADSSGQFLEKKAQLELSNNRFDEGLLSLKDLMRQGVTSQQALDLAAAYEQQQNTEVARSAYQAYLLAFPNDANAKTAEEKLPTEISPLKDRLRDMYFATYNDSLKRMNAKIANEYVASSEAIGLIAPQMDSVSVHLKQSAEVALSMRSFQKALAIYEWIIADYPDTKEAEQAMFRSAFIYDNDLGKVDIAKQYYSDFITKYPNSELADDAQFLMENLGKDDAEILESLQNNNKE